MDPCGYVQGRARSIQAEILRFGDVPLPVGSHPHGPRAQLHHGRRNRAVQDGTGHNVLHPMGWDAFGMPAENAAMAIGGHPKDWTYGNIADMREQMKPLGLSIDWSREFATCDPEYYGQQQALFLDFLEEGLVYRKNAVVNWDPVDMTVLANEQVEAGRGWRSGALVERRELTQWFFKISDHSEELLVALDRLDNWPAKVKLMQANWIGKSRGLQFAFSTIDAPDGHDRIEVYTTRPDTLMGASFVGISPDHPLAKLLEKDNAEMPRSTRTAAKVAPPQKRSKRPRRLGFDTGLRVRHPFDTAWELPVYIANFILMDYGTGAIFGCPAHDERDFEFATKYDLPIISTYLPSEESSPKRSRRPMCQPKPKRCSTTVVSRASNGRPVMKPSTPQSRSAKQTASAKASPNIRLRDWGLSASAIGAARSLWCIAMTVAWFPKRKRTCRLSCPMT